jgi:hypothetical protein
MAQGWVDRCIYVSVSGGTGSFVTSAAVEGYLTPSGAGATDGTTYHYAAQLMDPATGLPSEWEVGTGVYTSATHTLTRAVIEFNSDNTNTAHNFSSAPNIMLTILAADMAAFSGLSVGVTSIAGGTNTRVLYDNSGALGEYTNAQLTALIGTFTSSLSGAVGSSGGGTVNFLRADGTFQAAAQLNVADQNMSGGATVTSFMVSTGNYTVDCGSCPLQYITNGGTFTVSAPVNDGSCMLLISNGGSAGAVNFAGFSVGSNTGDTLTTTNGNKFTVSIWRINTVSGYRIAAHQ